MAIASNEISALNTIGITTEAIGVGEIGMVTTAGFIHDVNTSAYTDGAALFLSHLVSGSYTETRPPSPNYEVRMGGNAKTGTTDGLIYTELRIIGNTHDNFNFFNGNILEHHRVDVTSNGSVVTARIINEVSDAPLSMIFDQKYTLLPNSSSINLITGSDTVPVLNYIYVPKSTATLSVNSTGFPTNEQYVPVSRVLVESALRFQTSGSYFSQHHTSHINEITGQGHLHLSLIHI